MAKEVMGISGSKFLTLVGSATPESGKFSPKIPIFTLWIKKNLIGSGQ